MQCTVIITIEAQLQNGKIKIQQILCVRKLHLVNKMNLLSRDTNVLC